MDAPARHKVLYLVGVLLVTFDLLTCVHSQSDVRFSLKGTTYLNNSYVILENIGEGGDALLCVTNQTACCRPPRTALGNWFFPNRTRVPGLGNNWDFHRTRGQMMVRLNRRRGGEEGIYRCEIPDSMNDTQSIYIGVYSASTAAVLRGIPYKNNSNVTLENIGEGDNALLCITNYTACCRRPYTSSINRTALGNWYFPNGTRVPSSDERWDFHRDRGQMMVRLIRRRGGAEGIYHCMIPDTFGFIQTIYIGVYSANTSSPSVTSLTYDDQSRTLTCTFTGGPATIVSWRRDGVMINATYQQTKSLVNSVNGTYQTVLTIDPSLDQRNIEGTYSCTVENVRGESSETVVVTGSGDVWFSLRNAPYQNNSIVFLEDIGEGDDALLCMTKQTHCCRRPYTSGNRSVSGNWFFPNGTRVPSFYNRWDIYRRRDQMEVSLNRRRGGEEGIYCCEIPDTMNVYQTIYIGVYSASTGSPSVTSVNYDEQSRTLTCTSIGGPAATVTWRRNGVMITLNATYQQTKRLVDPVTGTYQTVLAIESSLDQRNIEGTYSCTVENDRGESSETVFVPATATTTTIIGLSVGVSLGVLLIAAVLTVVITILCVQKSRKKGTIPTDTYYVSKDAYEIMNLPQLPPSSDLNQNYEYAVLEPQTLPSPPDTITTDMNTAYANSIQTQPNAAYASTDFDVS